MFEQSSVCFHSIMTDQCRMEQELRLSISKIKCDPDLYMREIAAYQHLNQVKKDVKWKRRHLDLYKIEKFESLVRVAESQLVVLLVKLEKARTAHRVLDKLCQIELQASMKPYLRKQRSLNLVLRRRPIEKGITYRDLHDNYWVPELKEFCINERIDSYGKKTALVKRILENFVNPLRLFCLFCCLLLTSYF